MEEEIKNPEEQVEFEEYYEPLSYPSEDISAAYNAILAADAVDTGMLEDMDIYTEKVRQIRMTALDIIYLRLQYIKENIINESAGQ